MLNNQGLQQDQIDDFERPDLAGENIRKRIRQRSGKIKRTQQDVNYR
jgi:hypothetical protein